MSTRSLRREPVQSRSRERVERILDAAAALIEESGVAAVSVRAIAERAEVAPATLYQFFSNRDAVLERLFIREIDQIDARVAPELTTMTATSLIEAIDTFSEFVRRHYLTRPEFTALYYAARSNGAIRDEARAHLARLVDLLYDRLLTLGLLPAGTDRRVVEIAVEIGDHILELAYRTTPSGDRFMIGQSQVAMLRYLQAHQGS